MFRSTNSGCSHCWFRCFFQLEDLNFPEIKRKKPDERKEEDKKEFKDLFELDTDSDEENVGFPIKGTAPGLGSSSSFVCDVGQCS
mgnify:FL=1